MTKTLKCDKPVDLDEARKAKGLPRRKRDDPKATAYELRIRVPAEFQAFTGHKEACSRTPNDSVLLATGTACPVQSFRVGDRAYVTQFHPELDVARLVERMVIYRNAGYFDPDEFDTLVEAAHAAGVDDSPGRILRNFVELFAR